MKLFYYSTEKVDFTENSFFVEKRKVNALQCGKSKVCSHLKKKYVKAIHTNLHPYIRY